MPSAGKLLVLALDAASPTLLRRWAGDGTLPTLSLLMQDGLAAAMKSVEGLYVGATWPSFYTGHDPSGHGIYWSDRLRVGTYRVQRCGPRDFATRPALWEALSEAGRRVVVLDVPRTRRSPGLNGVQVVEWGVHDAAFGFQTTPGSLRREILAGVGRHPAPPSCDARRNLEEYLIFAEQLTRGAAARARLTRELLERQDWDFAIQVFSEPHCAGHQLWHFHDPAHPAFEASVTAGTGDLLRTVYRAVDAAIGEILAAVDADTTVVVLTLHGMSHACGGSLLLPEILERLGVLHTDRVGTRTGGGQARAPAAPQRTSPEPPPDSSRDPLRRVYRLLPEEVRRPLYNLRQYINQEWLVRGSPLGLDPDRTKAFYVGFGVGSTFSGIRLNLKGREPRGQVEPDEQAQFCDRLTDDLLAIVRPESDKPLVRRVLRTVDLFDGPYLSGLPDLLVEWEPEPAMGTSAAGTGAGAVWRAQSPAIGLIEASNSYCRTGEHRVDGLMVARGEGIVPGELGRVVSTLDLAPTFARLLGCEMPTPGGTLIAELVAS